MSVKEAGGYYVGQHGQLDVLDSTENRRFWVEGEIISLIPTTDQNIYALIRTQLGTGVYQVL
jgi:hypothetical protein